MKQYDLCNPRENMSQAAHEYAAWQQVRKQLKKLRIDLSKEEPLARALFLWGEEVAALRAEQRSEDTKQILDDRRIAYAPYVIRDDEP